MFEVHLLAASEGDALWLELGEGDDRRTLVIDAGRKETYRILAERIAGLGRPVDLLVITHIDDDHIFGAVPLLADPRVPPGSFRDVWYNGYIHLDRRTARPPAKDLLGPRNGEFFAARLLDRGDPWNAELGGRSVVVPDQGDLPVARLGGLELTLLSPTWAGLEQLRTYWDEKLEGLEPGDAEQALALFAETPAVQPDLLGDGGPPDVEGLLQRRFVGDTTAPNGSSIAFLAEFGGRAALFAADAHAAVLEQSLGRLLRSRGQRRLRLDAFKVAHHGSRSNTSPALLELLDCDRFLFSTNGTRHHHPDRETIARILDANRGRRQPIGLYFNYRTPENEVWDDPDLQNEWSYRAFYPPAGAAVDL